MLNPEPLQQKWQRLAFLPMALLILVAAGGGVAWLQDARSASADPPAPYFRNFEGAATVKVKNGNAWQTYQMQVCAGVLTNGPDGKILDAFTFGFDDGELGCIIICECGGSGAMANSAVGGGPVANNNGLGLAPGTFVADTQVRHATSGSGWKPPVQLTSQSSSFALQSSNPGAAGVYLNQDLRAMTPASTLTVKLLRSRAGLYFKLTGFVQLVANGPKVAVEIESSITGLDSPPEVMDVNPAYESDVDTDTSVVITYSEPVTIDPAGIYFTCSIDDSPYDPVPFTILGQGTAVITLDPIGPLPFDADCEVEVDPEAVDDVDTIDPPAFNYFSGLYVWFNTEFLIGSCAQVNPEPEVFLTGC